MSAGGLLSSRPPCSGPSALSERGNGHDILVFRRHRVDSCLHQSPEVNVKPRIGLAGATPSVDADRRNASRYSRGRARSAEAAALDTALRAYGRLIGASC